MSLRHKCLVSLMEAGATFKHNDPSHEDVLWEIRMVHTKLVKKSDELETKYKKLNKQLNDYKSINVINKHADDVHYMISYELFDTFTYAHGVDPSEVSWKEYFHIAYDAIVPEGNEPITIFDARNIVSSYELVPPPSDYPPTQRTRHINNLFKTYVEEYNSYLKSIDINSLIKEHVKSKTALGAVLLDIDTEVRQINSKLDAYSRVIDWSNAVDS